MAIVDCVVNKKKSLRSNKDFSDFKFISMRVFRLLTPSSLALENRNY